MNSAERTDPGYFIIKLGALGDVVQLTALLRELRGARPHARITVGTTAECVPLLREHSCVDDCMVFPEGWRSGAHAFEPRRIYKFWRELRTFRQTTAIIAHRHPVIPLALRAAGFRRIASFAPSVGAAWRGITHAARFDPVRHRLENQRELLRALGLEPTVLAPRLELNSAEIAHGEERWQWAGTRLRFALAPGGAQNHWSAMPNRRWPRERFHDLAAWLAQKNIAPAWIGSKNDRNLASDQGMNWAGRLSLRESLGVIARADFLIANDSAPLHMAGALQTPCLGLFGPTRGEHIMSADSGLALQGRVACGPCYNPMDSARGQAYRCPRPLCMEAISLHQVRAVIQAWLDRRMKSFISQPESA